jgi:predicted outer membrane repeat protein
MRAPSCQATVGGDGDAGCAAINPCLKQMSAECAVKTLVLLPGVHAGPGNVNVTINSNDSVAIIGSAARNGSGAIIDGGGTTWLFSVVGHGILNLTNVTLQRGCLSQSEATSTRDLFGGGAALSVVGVGSVHASGVRFLKNQVYRPFPQPPGPSEDNTNWGGAVFILGCASPDFDGRYHCVNGTQEWLDISFMDCEWEDNLLLYKHTTTTTGDGGGVCVQDASASFHGCSWRRNSAYYGGAVAYIFRRAAPAGAPQPVFTHCLFESNFAEYIGGGIYFQAASLVFDSCTWHNNSAVSGGGVCGSSENDQFSTSPQLSAFTSCVFTFNTADISGGGVALQGVSPSFASCLFHGNHASDGVHNDGSVPGGGGIQISTLTSKIRRLVLQNCTFTKNSAVTDGGGIFVAGIIELKFDQVIFQHNIASTGSGGAIFMPSNGHPVQHPVNFSWCSFSSNSALAGSGGALLLEISGSNGTAPPICTMLRTEFVNNAAGGRGGAVSAVFPRDIPTNLGFLNKSCSGMQCAGPASKSTPPTLLAQNVPRSWNSSVLLILTGMQFDQNSANDDGGALAVTNGAVWISNATLSSNLAEQYGGALFLDGTAALHATHTSWTMNAVNDKHTSGSADGQHIYAMAGAGAWDFRGSNTFVHQGVKVAGLSGLQIDSASGLQQGSVSVTCPVGAVESQHTNWVTNFTTTSPQWMLGEGTTTTTVTSSFYCADGHRTNRTTCTNGAWVESNSTITTTNNTRCEAEYFANFKCGNPPPVYPKFLAATVSVGCAQCGRFEAALPAGSGSSWKKGISSVTIKCEQCPKTWTNQGSAKCDSGLVTQQPGWWRAVDVVTGDTIFWACTTHQAACSSATSGLPSIDAQCSEGHTGPVCALCKHGYAMRLRHCVACTGDASLNAAIITVLGATIIGAGYVLCRWGLRLSIKKSFVTTFKIVVGFYSLLSLVTETFSIAWPPGYNTLLVWVKTAFASVADLSTVACALPISLYGQLSLWCGLLAVILLAIFLRFKQQQKTACIAAGAHLLQEAPEPFSDVNFEPNKMLRHEELHVKYAKNAFDAALLLYPFLSRAAVAVLKCREVNGVLYVEADYSLICEDKDWYLAATGSYLNFCV